jgi:hypothetical protein
MEKLFSRVENLADSVKEYVNTRIESVKLNVAEKSSAVISNVIARMVVAVVFIFFMGLASVALSIILGEWIGKAWAGFLVVAGLYLLIGVIVWVGKEKLIRLPVMNALIRQLFNSDEKDK